MIIAMSIRLSACHVYFVLATFFVFLPGVLRAQRIGFNIPPVARNRLFKVSFDWPVSRLLNSQPTVISSTKTILEHISHVEIATLRNLRNRTLPKPDDPLRVCNFDRKNWLNSVQTYFGNRGWAEPDLECVTELHGVAVSNSESPLHSLNTIFDEMRIRGQTLDGLAKNISDHVLGNWTDPHVVYDTRYNKLSQQCTLHNVGAVRVNGSWHIITSITNTAKEQQLPNFQRQFLIEFQRVGEGGKFVKPLVMRLPERPKDGKERITFENVTTSLSSWRGTAGSSFFIGTFPEDNLAVLDALDATDLHVQQAEDAMTPSSIAILVLPLFLNLVPISLLTEVSTIFTLVYVLFSDILTVVPLMIKGGELIHIGQIRERATVLRFSSSLDGSLSETAASELWAAECRANENVRVTGIVFLALGATCMIIGITFEVISRSYVKQRKARRRIYLREQQRLLRDLRNRQEWKRSYSSNAQFLSR